MHLCLWLHQAWNLTHIKVGIFFIFMLFMLFKYTPNTHTHTQQLKRVKHVFPCDFFLVCIDYFESMFYFNVTGSHKSEDLLLMYLGGATKVESTNSTMFCLKEINRGFIWETSFENKDRLNISSSSQMGSCAYISLVGQLFFCLFLCVRVCVCVFVCACLCVCALRKV